MFRGDLLQNSPKMHCIVDCCFYVVKLILNDFKLKKSVNIILMCFATYVNTHLKKTKKLLVTLSRVYLKYFCVAGDKGKNLGPASTLENLYRTLTTVE